MAALADESPRSGDDRFYTPRASARTGGTGYSSGDDGKGYTPRTAGTSLTARSDMDYYTPRGEPYDNSSSSDNEEFYSSRDHTADGSFPVVPMPYANGRGLQRSISGGGGPRMPPTHPRSGSGSSAGGGLRSLPVTVPGVHTRQPPVFTLPSPRADGGGAAGAGGGMGPGVHGGHGGAYRPAAQGAGYTVNTGEYATGGGGVAGGGGYTDAYTSGAGAGPVRPSDGGGYSVAAPVATAAQAGAAAYGVQAYATPAPTYGVSAPAYDAASAGPAYDVAPQAVGPEASAFTVPTHSHGHAPAPAYAAHGGYSAGGGGGKSAEGDGKRDVEAAGARGADYSAGRDTTSSGAGVSEDQIVNVWSLTRHNRYKEVQSLLDKGLPVNVRDRHGNTILATACQNGLKRIAKIALRAGADINARNVREPPVPPLAVMPCCELTCACMCTRV